nr:FAD-dependent oxidoreductase [Candidatus Parabeggiatoa sp.]
MGRFHDGGQSHQINRLNDCRDISAREYLTSHSRMGINYESQLTMRNEGNLMSSSSQSSPVVIVGGGAAGLSCALSAAAQGINVVLLEKTAELGGTVTQALIHSIGGLFDDQGNFLNSGLPVELAERLSQASPHTRKRRIGKTWVLDVDPGIYTKVITDWITTTPNIDVSYHSSVTSVSIHAGYIEQISITYNGESCTLRPHALIDTTGNASIVRHIDAELLADGLALGGFILQLRGISPNALQFPKSVALLREIRKAVDNDELPVECSTLWLDTGVYPDEAYAKFNVTPVDYDANHMKAVAKRLLTFLQTLPGFTGTFINRHGQLGIRDGGRIKGEYCLTETDIKEGKRFADVACRACWPIEHWHPQKGISLEYLPAGHHYDIPLCSLKVAGFTNLWAAGKCLSAEPRAQASARVAGTCWAMGEAVGKKIFGSSR